MTLHSVSHAYPVSPTAQEKQLVSQWLDLFRDTITCSHCQGHFSEMLQTYRELYPHYLDSRREFLLFVYRAHNTVNRRLDKPVYLSSQECGEVYARNIATRTAKDYRIAYLNHIMRNWKTMHDMNGIAAVRKVQEMMRVESQYWSPRDTGHVEVLVDENVTPLPANARPGGRPEIPQLRLVRPAGPVGFRGGRLRFR